MVIMQPRNVTGCVGGTAMFTCVMWWRLTTNHSNMQQRRIVRKQGTTSFNITSSISGETNKYSND